MSQQPVTPPPSEDTASITDSTLSIHDNMYEMLISDINLYTEVIQINGATKRLLMFLVGRGHTGLGPSIMMNGNQHSPTPATGSRDNLNVVQTPDTNTGR